MRGRLRGAHPTRANVALGRVAPVPPASRYRTVSVPHANASFVVYVWRAYERKL